MAEERLPTFEQTLASLLDSWQGRIYTALPGVVRAYDRTSRTATVAPGLKRGLLDGTVEEIPPIQEVRVLFPEAGSWEITWPLEVGDEGVLLFSSRSLEVWRANGGVVDPRDRRKHDLSDAWFLPGGRSRPATSAAPAGMLSIKGTDGARIELEESPARVTITGASVRLGDSTAASKAATAPLVDAQLAALSAVFAAWVPAPGDGGAALKTALTTLIGTGWPASTACTKVDLK